MNNFFLKKIIKEELSENKNIANTFFYKIVSKGVNLKYLKSNFERYARSNNFEACVEYCNYAIKKFPNNTFGYIEKSKLYRTVNNESQADEILRNSPFSSRYTLRQKVDNTKPVKNKSLSLKLPTAAKRTKNISSQLKKLTAEGDNIKVVEFLNSNFHELTVEQMLLLCNIHQQMGNYICAFNTLIDAQKKYTNERKILMRIGEILQNDKKITQAHIYFKSAQIFYPEYGAVRKLSFEVDNNLLSEAKQTLRLILSFNTLSLLKFLPVINRVSSYFPEHRADFIRIRNEVKNILSDKDGRKGLNPSDQVKVAIKCRWYEVAETIILRNERGIKPVSDANITWAKSARSNYFGFEQLFALANYNDENTIPFGIFNGQSIEITNTKPDLKCIELFIPSVFFTEPKEEKPSYVTVRNFFRNIYAYILKRDDIIIIPRHQWNWRKCDLLDENHYSISYHTHEEMNPKRLHIQESTLANRCSMDNMGFAGYSSLSNGINFEEKAKIECNLISEVNRQALYYIENNISKYKQLDEDLDISNEYVFIPMQVTTDIVAALAYIDSITLLNTVANYFCNSDIKVVVKRHPYCKSLEVERLISELSSSNKIIVTEASVHNLIKNAKAVLTVNSGVGLESIIHNKPVIATGKSEYSYATAAIAHNEDELLNILDDLESIISLPTKRNEFLEYYFLTYALPYDALTDINKRLEQFI